MSFVCVQGEDVSFVVSKEKMRALFVSKEKM